MKKISDEIEKVMKKTNFNALKKKVSNLERKILEETTLIQINQYNTGKQKLEEKHQMFIKITRCKWFSDYNCFEYKNQFLSQKNRLCRKSSKN